MERTAVDDVLELVSLLQRDMAHSFARDGLTEARAHLLWLLQEGPRTQRELADGLGVTPRNVTGLVDGLAATGHAVRGPHPTDRRATLVDLTEEGSRLLVSMTEGYAELQEVLFGGLSDPEVTAFRSTLVSVTQRLRERLEAEGVR